MWGVFLSEPLGIVALVGRYPANWLMPREPIRHRRIFYTKAMQLQWLWGITHRFQ